MTTAGSPRRYSVGLNGLRGVLAPLAILYAAAALFEIADDFRHHAVVPAVVALILLAGGCFCIWRAARTEGKNRRRFLVAGIVAFALGVLQAGLWWIALHAAVAVGAVFAWRASRTRKSKAGGIALLVTSIALALLWLAMLLVALLLALSSDPT